jgi:hypothetical protein
LRNDWSGAYSILGDTEVDLWVQGVMT